MSTQKPSRLANKDVENPSDFGTLPKEIVSKILSLLDPKPLTQLMCLNKSWCFLVRCHINDPKFVARHLFQMLDRMSRRLESNGASLAGMEQRINYVSQQNDYLIEQSRHHAGYMHQWSLYDVERAAAMAHLFTQLDVRWEGVPVNFPTPPPFPPFNYPRPLQGSGGGGAPAPGPGVEDQDSDLEDEDEEYEEQTDDDDDDDEMDEDEDEDEE